MIILDIMSYNLTNMVLFSAPLVIYELNDRKLYMTLIFDIIFNGIPFCSMIIVLLYFLNRKVIKYFNNSSLYRFISSIVYMIIYGIVIFSIFNKFDVLILRLLVGALPINIVFNLMVIFLKRGHTFN